MGLVHIKASDLSFGFPGHPVLEQVNFTISAGERLALVGENGSGKTTLLRLLTGDLVATAGTIEVTGALSYVAQELQYPDGYTVGDVVTRALGEVSALTDQIAAQCDNFDHDTGDLTELTRLLDLADHLAAWDAPRRVDEALTRLNACRDHGRALDTLSVGERFRVRLAATLAQRAPILLLDEPTNHLDHEGIGFLTAELMGRRGITVVVTHDRMLLDDVATSILDLDPSMDGRPVLYGQPGYLTYRFAKNEDLRRWRQRYQAERKRAILLEHRLDRSYEGLSDEWRPPKGSQKHRRQTGARIHVKAADRLVEQLKAKAVEVPVPPPTLRFPELPARSRRWDPGTVLVDVRNVRVGPEDAPRLDLPGRRVTLEASGRLLITGPNGSGKSTLLALMAGRLQPDRGYVARFTGDQFNGARYGVLHQEDSEHAGDAAATSFDEYAAHALRLLQAELLDPDILVPLASLGLMTEEDLDRPVAELSVGQRRRFDLACALLAVPHVLLMDEPTNHLSIDLVDDLTQALRKTPAAVVIATHDRRMIADFHDWPRLELG